MLDQLTSVDGLWNTSQFDLPKLLDDPDHIADDPRAYIAGFSRVARQRTCPIGELIHPDGETRRASTSRHQPTRISGLGTAQCSKVDWKPATLRSLLTIEMNDWPPALSVFRRVIAT